ncbi:MAG: ZIP family metal transporter [Candidatus Omnitrophica bacterium]|nr:ZIP family metal transporter [Candidatus Omnitrophota bacterium]
MVLFWILASTSLVSLISLVGILTLALKDNLLHKIIFCLIGFSAGALIGSAFLHILPEAIQTSSSIFVFYCLILGIILFFLMERYLHWRHCHDKDCHIHAFTYLNLFGEAFHNFIDGIAIAASFIISIKLGVATTLAIIFHEIPKELGNFGVLIYGGFSRKRALLYNFISALMAILGAVTGYFISDFAHGFSHFIMPLTAGGFIYIAMSDLIPEVHKENNQRQATLAFISFLLGIVFMAIAKTFLSD